MKYKKLTIFILLALFTFPFLFSCSNVYTYSNTKISSKPDNKKIKISPIKKYDLITDSSVQKFVWQKVHFLNLKYSPTDLINLSWSNIKTSKTIKLRKVAYDSFILLSKNFYKKFKTSIVVVSWYRDYNYQVNIKKWWCLDNLCAKAWYSEHQTWLALDLFEATTNEQFLFNKKYSVYFDWLKINAPKYWFHNSYQKWEIIDWYEKEPWHWRFVWIDFAELLSKEKISLTEYYNK